jgi:site-specific DNA-methyltransferase (adenine-specific)
MSKIKISDLTPDDKNYNKGTQFGNSLIEKSLRKFGAGRSILLDKNNRIIAGNKTIENAYTIGLEDVLIVETTGNQIVAVKRMDIDLDSKIGRELALADNASAKANIDWDLDNINQDWSAEESNEWGIDNSAFVEELEAEEDDFDEAPPLIPITVLGDLYEIGEHRLLCGDSTDSDMVSALMNGEKADMVFTDPPYGVSYTGGHNKKQRTGIIADELQGEDLSSLFEDSINTACIFSKDSAPFYIWYAGGKSKETYLGLSKTPIEVRAVICWYKVKSGSGAFMSQYIPNYEPCIYGHKQGKSIQWFGPTDEKTVWEFKKDNVNDFHPTQKPIDVVERALNNSSSKGQLIYDAFGGSGSTMVGSHQLKRIANLMELDPKYCDVIVKRMIKLDDSLTIKRNGIDVTKEFKSSEEAY